MGLIMVALVVIVGAGLGVEHLWNQWKTRRKGES